jgi:pilus assembly protein CpaE
MVDQNPENRAELPRMLQLAGISVVGDAGFGIEATTVVAEMLPQFVLLSLEDPVVRGLQTMDAIAEIAPQVPIIVYSSLTDGASIRKAMLAGARDYLLSGERTDRGPSGTVITLFGAKGGIGKTTIATNLATALCRETGESVVIVDMDTRFGDVAVMMDMPSERTVTEAARDYERLDRSNIREYLHNHPTGVSVLPAPQNPSDWEMIGPEPIEKIVRVLSQTFNYVILDTPGTFNEIVGISLELVHRGPAHHEHGRLQHQRHGYGTQHAQSLVVS